MSSEFNVFIDYQKFANKMVVELLGEINSKLNVSFLSELTEIKKQIDFTLEGISSVTSREIKSYDAITGMLIALDYKLEKFKKNIMKNFNFKIEFIDHDEGDGDGTSDDSSSDSSD